MGELGTGREGVGGVWRPGDEGPRGLGEGRGDGWEEGGSVDFRTKRGTEVFPFPSLLFAIASLSHWIMI